MSESEIDGTLLEFLEVDFIIDFSLSTIPPPPAEEET